MDRHHCWYGQGWDLLFGSHRTVSAVIDSTSCRCTSLSAIFAWSNNYDRLGGWEQALAMAYASPLTPNFLGVPGRGSSFSTISRPCWTRRLRTLCTACKANTHYLGNFLTSLSLIAQKKTPAGLSLRDECWP